MIQFHSTNIKSTQVSIPCLFMRGGTSRGLYFLKSDLPKETSAIEKILLSAMGSPSSSQIDGVGGGTSVTNKVAILSPSTDPWADVDYWFAQVGIHQPIVDWGPTCGNILSGVGPAVIERGLIVPESDETVVKIRAVNTQALIEAQIQTPGGRLTYIGDTAIDGVPGTAAPIQLDFSKFIGGKTGSAFPTGSRRDIIEGFQVTCIDAAMPMVIARAEDFGKTGCETKAELDRDSEFLTRLEKIRCRAGHLMGLGDVSNRVIPKFSLIAPPSHGGSITSRYFVPQVCHPTHALTGGICVACCACFPGTVAEGIAVISDRSIQVITIEHPSGRLDLTLETDNMSDTIRGVSIVRTARLLFSGNIHVPVSSIMQ